MAKTMKWPPIPENGRIPMVEGVAATTVIVIMTLSDLRANPFNSPDLSLGDLTFQTVNVTRARIEAALKRLERTITIDAVTERLAEDGSAEYTVAFTDRETRAKAEVTVHG